jgi:hypothetical protein
MKAKANNGSKNTCSCTISPINKNKHRNNAWTKAIQVMNNPLTKTRVQVILNLLRQKKIKQPTNDKRVSSSVHVISSFLNIIKKIA